MMPMGMPVPMMRPFPEQQRQHRTMMDEPEDDPEAYDIADLIEEYGQEADT